VRFVWLAVAALLGTSITTFSATANTVMAQIEMTSQGIFHTIPFMSIKIMEDMNISE
jgi:hypothetical protein